MAITVISIINFVLFLVYALVSIKLRDECERLIKESDELFEENNELREQLDAELQPQVYDVDQDTLREMFEQICEFADPNREVNFSLCEELAIRLKDGEKIKFKFYAKEPDYVRINRICGNIPFLVYKYNRMETNGAQFTLELELMKNVGGERNN